MKSINITYILFFLAINLLNSQEQSILYKQDSTNLKNFLGFSYWLDTFETTFKPRHYVSLNYERKTNFGNIVTRLGYADRFETEDINLEIEAYPRISDKSYMLIEYGAAFKSTLFPEHRLGLEYFRIFNRTYEASLGYKYLQFTNRNISIYTGSLGKYYKNYWFNGRMFITTSEGSSSNSYAFIARRYFKDKYNYVSLNLGYGIFFEQINVSDAFGKSYRAGLNSQFEVSKNTFLKLSFDYRSEELLFDLGNYINRYTFVIELKQRF